MDSSMYRDHGDMEEHHWWFRGRRAIVSDVLRRHLPEPGAASRDRQLLDVGCGTGGMLGMLSEFGSVTGMDLSPEAIELCKKRYGDKVHARVGGIPEDLPPPASVDVLSAFDVVEHIDDDLRALENLQTTLRPGGRLIVTVPAYMFLWSEHDDLNHHKRRYRRRELRDVLTKAGFRIEALSYYNTWLFPIVALVRFLRRRAATSRGRSDFALPPRLVNALLTKLFASERYLLRKLSLPFGVSLIAVSVKPEQPCG